MLENDPFTLVYDFLHDSLINSPAVVKEVRRQQNIVSLNKGHGQDQIRMNLKEADVPEIGLFSSTVSGNFNLCSSASEIDRIYRLIIRTGTGTIGSTLFPLEWAVACSIVRNNFEQSFRQLEWAGNTFVRDVRHQAGESGEVDANKSAGIMGWVAIWSINVRMVFSQADMIRIFNTGTTEEQNV